MTLAVATVALLGLAGCKTTEEAVDNSGQTSGGFDQGTDVPSEPAPRSGGATGLDLGTIYFDFDRSEIRDDARAVLRTNAETLRSSNGSVTIEGHCDERGDEEYNLALGERRATSVKRYLENLGVPAGSMRTISYGESKPAAMGHDESAWQWNRRAEFK